MYSSEEIYVGHLPVITVHPDNKTMILTNTSTTAQFNCEAVGVVSYEWKTQSGDIPTNAIGWNSNILTLNNLSMSDNDSYQCVASNSSGNSSSYFATLLIESM